MYPIDKIICGFYIPIIVYIFAVTVITKDFYTINISKMETFGKKLKSTREVKNFSQAELAKQIGSYHSIIGKYERDEVKPTIDVVKRLADVLETTAGYLLGESEDRELLKDPSMLKRLNDISKFPEADKNCILYALDAMINNVKLKAI
jgi:transcriptional regulator with XRE-family HTH domain